MNSGWLFYAILSAVFAAATSILAKWDHPAGGLKREWRGIKFLEQSSCLPAQ